MDNKVDLAYGRRPNNITVIDKSGKIIYYRDWFRYGEVDEFLTKLLAEEGNK